MALTVFAGCLGRTPKATFYTLTPTTAAVASAEPAAIAVGVGPATMPKYLEGTRIVTREGSQIFFNEFERWGSGLGAELLRVLGANLAAELGTDRVVVYPAAPQFPLDLRVVLEVIRFDGSPSEGVTLQVRWTLTRDVGAEPIAVVSSDIHEPLEGSGTDAFAAAHSAAVGRLSHEIAERIRGS